MFQPIMPTLKLLESTLVQQETHLQRIEKEIKSCEETGDPFDELAFWYSCKHQFLRKSEPIEETPDLFPNDDSTELPF